MSDYNRTFNGEAKAKLGETNRDHDELNTILETVGKTL